MGRASSAIWLNGMVLGLLFASTVTSCSDDPARPGASSSTTADPVEAAPAPSELAGPWRDSAGDELPDGQNAEDGFAVGVHAFTGPEHCGWQNLILLHVAWPPGSVTSSYDRVRQFVWSLDGELGHGPLASDTGEAVRGRPEGDVDPPTDASSTGVHTGEIELWTAPSDEDAVYLRRADGRFDRWPRAEPPLLCE